MKFLKYLAFILFGLLTIFVLLSIKQDIPIDDLKATYAQTPSKFIKIKNINIHYRIEGVENDTLPIILIHGTGASLHTFDAWTKELSVSKKVIRMDLPGFGLTGPFPDRNYSISSYISTIDTFLFKLGVKKCIMAGNSLGGNIAWQYTLMFPEKVHKLILIDAAGLKYTESKPPLAFRIARIPILNKLLTMITPKSMARKSIEDVYYNKALVTDEIVDRYFNLTLREGNRQAMVDRMTTPIDYSALKDLGEIYIPTLILWGENDLLIPLSSALEFSKKLPNDTLIVIHNCGHVPMEECPSETLKPVLNFISN